MVVLAIEAQGALSRMRIWSNGRAIEQLQRHEKMRQYLELPVHGGKENNSPPSYTDMGIGSVLARAVRIRTTMSG